MIEHAGDSNEQFFEYVLAVLAREEFGITFKQDLAVREKQDTVADFG